MPGPAGTLQRLGVIAILEAIDALGPPLITILHGPDLGSQDGVRRLQAFDLRHEGRRVVGIRY